MAVNLSTNLSNNHIQTDWLSTDVFLNDRETRNKLGISGYNPESVDANGLLNAILLLRQKAAFEYRPYDNRLGRKIETPKTLTPQDIVILEGIHSFHNDINEYIDLKIFIDSDEETLKKMRHRGNILKRGMDASVAGDKIDNEFNEFEKYILPNKNLADLIIRVDIDFDYEIDICK